MTSSPLHDRRILVVEDEYLLADEMQCELEAGGAEIVGPVGGLSQALAVIDTTPDIDGAILDLNLRGEMAFPAAEILQDRNVPILFVTGYDATVIPERFKNTPFRSKPVNARQVTLMLAEILR